jgi:hypothetical protein
VADDDDLVRLLTSIDRRLALLTASQDRDLRMALRENLLGKPARLTMFDAIDGIRTSPELAKLAGVSERTAQLFVKELLDLGVVRRVPGADGRTVIVERDETGIIAWYLEWNALA